MSAKKDNRPMRYGWAPGKYLNKCHTCTEMFIGDKRAVMCADCAYALPDPVTTTEHPPEPSELDRLRAEVVELKDILREGPSTLDEAGMEGNCEARGDTDGAELHRTNVKRWLKKVQAAISSSEQAKP